MFCNVYLHRLDRAWNTQLGMPDPLMAWRVPTRATSGVFDADV
jgi:hypothetical protein